MKKWSGYIIVTLAIFTLYFFFYIFTGNGLPCLFHKLTGFYCPGCGISRMFISIFKLEFYQAFRYNSLVFILLICSLGYFVIDFFFFKKNNKHFQLPNAMYIILLTVVLLFGILRNIPFFSFLTPTIVN